MLKETPQKIIVRMPNWVGDAVMGSPVLGDLREQWPDAQITAMCQGGIGLLFVHDPHIDEVFRFQKPSGWIRHHHHRAIIDPIQCGKYDLGILLTNSFSSAWWFWRGKVKYRLGYEGNWRNFLLSEAISYPQDQAQIHEIDSYKNLLEPLGIPHSSRGPQLYISDEEINEAKELLGLYGIDLGKHIVVGVNPGAAFGSAKCWLPERFREVTQRLIENKNTFVVYFADATGTPLVNDICRDLPDRVVNLGGKTSLRELMALISLCTVMLTNDSGPMHIAAALQVPLVALFGSTSDIRTGPSYGNAIVIHKHVECSPCYKRVCPIDFRCMTGIGVDEVYDALQKQILSCAIGKKSI